ncbi:MAG: AAA family ATPase [Bacteroidales bacterium]|nr:AAA family ATPase [Bacteroidales bacterium]MBP5214486.1 AAA family ATPase [Bacteroidales bacterium]
METNNRVYITDIEIQTLWGDTSIEWHNLDPRINIIVGQNGFGKTTMLNLIKAVLSKDDKFCRMLKAKVKVRTTVGEMYFDGKQMVHKPAYGGFDGARCFHYVNTFDVPASKKSSLSQLGISLDSVLYQRSDSIYSFSDYRLSMLKDLSTAQFKQERINKFFDLIDMLFASTGKRIEIDDKNRVVFKKGRTTIQMDHLSAGEKQILLLLFTLFLMEDKSNVILLDEPEISLHVEWQDRLINLMLDINPNCQIIMTTHSPSIFADGWEDKLVFISDLISNP